MRGGDGVKSKLILDACCGGRMFWFNRNQPNTLFIDKRKMEKQIIWVSKDKKEKAFFEVTPDRIMDFRSLKLPDNTFYLVVFDPPHIVENCSSGWQRKKYGELSPITWKDDIRKGFEECFRVLRPYGVLIFKWCEIDKKLKEILDLSPQKPLFGHRSGKQQKTHWLCFMKIPKVIDD